MNLGNRLHVSRDYFIRAHSCVLEIGVMLGQVLWRKMLSGCLLDADKHLNDVCYELLVERRYDSAITLLDFATCTLKRFGSEEYRRMMVVNRAQAYKWRGESDKCKTIMESEDWSASQDSFKLADAVLKDDVGASAEIMRRIGAKHDVVTKESYRDWPLFRKIRTQGLFRETYEGVFGEPLEKVRVKAEGGAMESESGAETDSTDEEKGPEGPEGAVH